MRLSQTRSNVTPSRDSKEQQHVRTSRTNVYVVLSPPRLGKEILRWQEIITSADPDAQSTLTVGISGGHKHIGITALYNFRYT